MPATQTTIKAKPRPAPTAAQALANARRATKGTKVGRPLTYSPALCQRAVALGLKGQTWAGVARAFGISRSTLNEWEGLYPEFADALARARAAAQAYLEDHGRRNLKADRYQAQVWTRLIAVHDDYREQRSGGGMEALPDFLAAIMEAAESRKIAKAAPGQPGDDAKLINPPIVEPNKAE